MREVVAAVTRKGQTTIPLEVRKRLGLGPQDKVAFVLTDDNRVEVRRSEARSVVEETTGIFKSMASAQTAEQLREMAEQVIVDEAIERVKAA